MKEFKFSIEEEVKIIPLNLNGVVKSIWIGDRGVQYEVRYFDKAEARTIYFYEKELGKINE